MITIDCPLCEGTAIMDEGLTTVRCDGCDLTVDIGPDLAATALDTAA